MAGLGREFIEKRSSVLKHVPQDWNIEKQPVYRVDLRMCQLRELRYNFYWEDQSQGFPAYVSDQAARVVMLDVSLNDLSVLDHEGLQPLHQLRNLDASLNRLHNFVGVESLKQLRVLNLSHNAIKKIDGLYSLFMLVELNLGMNEIQDISYMPALANLTVLYLNNNKLTSLDGVQALAHLRELYVQHNRIRDLIPLSSSLQLVSLNAAGNQIHSLKGTVSVLRGLRMLQTLVLLENPVEQENNYQSLLIDGTTVVTLDNVNMRPQQKLRNVAPRNDTFTIKDAARQAFREQMEYQRQKMEESVRYLQQRILNIQDDFYMYEARMQRDMDNCLRFLEGFNTDDGPRYDVDYFRGRIGSPQPQPWRNPPREDFKLEKEDDSQQQWPQRPRSDKPDYSTIKKTDEVLRCVYKELSRNPEKIDT